MKYKKHNKNKMYAKSISMTSVPKCLIVFILKVIQTRITMLKRKMLRTGRILIQIRKGKLKRSKKKMKIVRWKIWYNGCRKAGWIHLRFELSNLEKVIVDYVPKNTLRVEKPFYLFLINSSLILTL